MVAWSGVFVTCDGLPKFRLARAEADKKLELDAIMSSINELKRNYQYALASGTAALPTAGGASVAIGSSSGEAGLQPEETDVAVLQQQHQRQMQLLTLVREIEQVCVFPLS